MRVKMSCLVHLLSDESAVRGRLVVVDLGSCVEDGKVGTAETRLTALKFKYSSMGMMTRMWFETIALDVMGAVCLRGLQSERKQGLALPEVLDVQVSGATRLAEMIQIGGGRLLV